MSKRKAEVEWVDLTLEDDEELQQDAKRQRVDEQSLFDVGEYECCICAGLLVDPVGKISQRA